MKNNLFLILLIFLAGCNGCNNDVVPIDTVFLDRCQTTNYHQELEELNPQYLIIQQEAEVAYRKAIENIDASRIADLTEIRTIPIVFHLIGDDVIAQIDEFKLNEQITILNEDYRKLSGTHGDGNGVDLNIEFCLSSIDADGNQFVGYNSLGGTYDLWHPWDDENDEELKSLIHFPPEEYLNIYVVDLAFSTNQYGNLVANLGRSSFPWDMTISPQLDGVVIDKDYFGYTSSVNYNLGRTLTHEVGHWLGLYHTFHTETGEADCVITDCTSFGDRICDTPPCKVSYTCLINNSCNPDSPSGSDLNDQIDNFMAYSPDDCLNMFSQGQKNRVNIMLSDYRPLIANSSKCESDDDDDNPTIPTNFAGKRLKIRQIMIYDKKDTGLFNADDDVSYVSKIFNANCDDLGFEPETEFVDVSYDQIGEVVAVDDDIDAYINSAYYLTPGDQLALLVYEYDPGNDQIDWTYTCGTMYAGSNNDPYGRLYINYDDFPTDGFNKMYQMDEGWIIIQAEFIN